MIYKIAKFLQTFLIAIFYFFLVTTQFYMLVIFFIEISVGENGDATKYYVEVEDTSNYFDFSKFN